MSKLHTLIHELISIMRMEDQGLGVPSIVMLNTASKVLHRLPVHILERVTIDWYSSSVDIIWDVGDDSPLIYIECDGDGTIRFCNTTEDGNPSRRWAGAVDDFSTNYRYLLSE